MVLFAERFPDREIVRTLSGQLGWSHFAEYLTELPPRPLLEKKLHDAITLARRRLIEGEAS